MANRTKSGARVPVEHLAEAQRQLDITQAVLQCVITERPVATPRVIHDGWSTLYKLYRPTGAHGGLVLLVSRPTGNAKQRPSVTGQTLDSVLQVHAHIRETHLTLYAAMEPAMREMREARDKAFDAERTPPKVFVAGGHRFKTMADANAYCEGYRSTSGVILGIEEVTR